MKIAIVLACAVAMAAAFDYTKEWEEWKDRFEKEYESDTMELYRHTIWEANKKRVDEHNSHLDTWSFRMEMNEFADYDSAEFSRIYNGLLPNRKRVNSTRLHVRRLAAHQTPDSVDWREKGVVSEVKNQGQCGSCWSFATTGSLEGQHALKSGQLVSLSEQQLVDCSTSYGNHGCQGGLMDYAFKYIKENNGDDTEMSYPYTAKNGQCHFNPSTIGATDTGYVDVPSEDCASLKDAVATVGPIAVAMDASHSSFQMYSGGIYDEPACSQTRLDHGVLAVGYGTEDGDDYWIIKNSWGASWGDQGYFKIKSANNMCGICTQPSYPTV